MLVVTQDGLHTLRTDEIIGFFNKENSLWCRTYDQGELLIGEYDSPVEVNYAIYDYRLNLRIGESKLTFPPKGHYKDFHARNDDDD